MEAMTKTKTETEIKRPTKKHTAV